MKPYITTALIVMLSITVGILATVNHNLNYQLYKAGSDIEATDDYYSSQLGDYQMDVNNDTIIIRDGDRLVGHFMWEDNTPLGDILTKDNE